MYSGAVDCRKMALAAVVSFVAATKRVSVAAYATATTSTTGRYRDSPATPDVEGYGGYT
jgi:hypothetical protein